MLAKLRKPVPDRDRIVILEEDGTADIATVFDTDDQAIFAASAAQEYSIPAGTAKSYVGPNGRIYVLAASPDFVRETKRLAELEKSIVLRQITHYQTETDEKKKIKLREIMLYVLVAVLLLAVIFK